MKTLLSIVIVIGLFAGSCSRKRDAEAAPKSEVPRVSKIYQFDTLFYVRVSKKHRDDNNLGDKLYRLSPKGHLAAIGVELSDSDVFRFEQDFIHLEAPFSTHDLLKKGYEDLMNKPLRELSSEEYSAIISSRDYYSNDSDDDPFGGRKKSG